MSVVNPTRVQGRRPRRLMEFGAYLTRMAFELTNTDHQIATILETGPATEAELVELTGVSSERIRDRLSLMEEGGYVRRTGDTPPQFELVEDPR